jgi:hypothetical protein
MWLRSPVIHSADVDYHFPCRIRHRHPPRLDCRNITNKNVKAQAGLQAGFLSEALQGPALGTI